jgi:cytochrome c biogenesis protein
MPMAMSPSRVQVVMLPQDSNFTSLGAIKAPDARPERLAFEALFLPTAVLNDQGPHSIFPDALNPALFANVWYGPPKVETGKAGKRLLP